MSIPYFAATLLAARYLKHAKYCSAVEQSEFERRERQADEFCAIAAAALLTEFDLALGNTHPADYRAYIERKTRVAGPRSAELLVKKWLRSEARFPVFWEDYLAGREAAAPFERRAGSRIFA